MVNVSNYQKAHELCNQVMVYGSLRRAHGNFRVLERSNAVHIGDTRMKLEMKMVSLGGFPALIPSKDEHWITGEVYQVDQGGLHSVDMLEGYPHFYNRCIVDTEYGPTWLYYLTSDDYDTEDRPTVEGGDWTDYMATRGVY